LKRNNLWSYVPTSELLNTGKDRKRFASVEVVSRFFMFSVFKAFQLIGSVFGSLIAAISFPYLLYRYSPETWFILEDLFGFGLTFGVLFLVIYVVAMLMCWRLYVR